MNIIECKSVSKRFSGQGEVISALENVSFEVSEGQIVGLLGPDGAGKTTLMRLMCGLLSPTTGIISVLGFDSVRQAAQIQSSIGYMPQKFGLYENMTVAENLNLYAQLHGVSRAEAQSRFPRLMEMANLSRFTDRMAGKLSGGMKQKLALACALVSRPKLLLLDEPTVGVDILARRELWAILKQIVSTESTTVMASTAYMDEADFCDHALVLFEGKLIANRPPGEIEVLASEDAQPKISSEDEKTVKLHNIENQSKQETAGAAFERGFQVLLSGSVPPPLVRQKPFESSSEVIVRAEKLTKRFGKFVAVNEVSFEVHRGEIFGLLGANGAGKTTTFRAMCGLSGYDGGTIEICGRDLNRNQSFARSQIGYVAQKFSLYGDISVRDNLEFFGGAYGVREPKLRERMAWGVETFGLQPYLKMDAGKLSMGFKRRLAMACALLHQPPILFLDEATSGADPMARRDFWLRIMALADEGTAVIITTHFLDEARYCDRMAIMQDGVAIAAGTGDQIIEQSGGAPNIEEAFVKLIQRKEAEE